MSELESFVEMLTNAAVGHVINRDEDEGLSFVKVADFKDNLCVTFTFDQDGDLDNVMRWDHVRQIHVA